MKPTDQQLKQALAKMLPEKTAIIHCGKLHWLSKPEGKYLANEVLDTELLHLCWLAEKSLDYEDWSLFISQLGNVVRTKQIVNWIMPYNYVSASWQQHVIALAKVKGIEIV